VQLKHPKQCINIQINTIYLPELNRTCTKRRNPTTKKTQLMMINNKNDFLKQVYVYSYFYYKTLSKYQGNMKVFLLKTYIVINALVPLSHTYIIQPNFISISENKTYF